MLKMLVESPFDIPAIPFRRLLRCDLKPPALCRTVSASRSRSLPGIGSTMGGRCAKTYTGLPRQGDPRSQLRPTLFRWRACAAWRRTSVRPRRGGFPPAVAPLRESDARVRRCVPAPAHRRRPPPPVRNGSASAAHAGGRRPVCRACAVGGGGSPSSPCHSLSLSHSLTLSLHLSLALSLSLSLSLSLPLSLSSPSFCTGVNMASLRGAGLWAEALIDLSLMIPQVRRGHDPPGPLDTTSRS